MNLITGRANQPLQESCTTLISTQLHLHKQLGRNGSRLSLAHLDASNDDGTNESLFMEWIVRPIRAVFFADEQAFNWIQKKLGLSNYQMAALVWLKGLIIGLLLGWWLL